MHCVLQINKEVDTLPESMNYIIYWNEFEKLYDSGKINYLVKKILPPPNNFQSRLFPWKIS